MLHLRLVGDNFVVSTGESNMACQVRGKKIENDVLVGLILAWEVEDIIGIDVGVFKRQPVSGLFLDSQGRILNVESPVVRKLKNVDADRLEKYVLDRAYWVK